jgi:hypothetical protein
MNANDIITTMNANDIITAMNATTIATAATAATANPTMINGVWHIDLTTPEAALAYLRGLPPQQEISLPEADFVGTAVRVITSLSATEWSNGRARWEWTAGELAATLAAELEAMEAMEETEETEAYWAVVDPNGPAFGIGATPELAREDALTFVESLRGLWLYQITAEAAAAIESGNPDEWSPETARAVEAA